MSTHCRIPGTILGSLIALLIGGAGQAMAQDCTASLTDSGCYHLKGSDTLFDIITQSINSARTAGIAGAKNLYYDGTGSGNAENQMKFNGCTTGTCAAVTGASIPLGVQSIGPMSRNFRPGTIDSASVGFAAADGATASKQGHVSWTPGVQNVVGLDAAVFIIKGTLSFKNVNFPTFVDSAVSTDATTRAVTNNTALPVGFGDGSAFNNTSPTVNYSNLLMVVMGGVDGSGTLAACSDPRRVQAVQDLASALGVSTIDHLYRRDDNSGTTDTWKDRIITIASSADPRYPWLGGRFCNGQSIGGINGAATQTGFCATGTPLTVTTTTCTKDANCATVAPASPSNACWFNRNNQDLDPIRRPCVAADATHAPTSCTNVLTGAPCNPGDVNCTQGLVVALTDADPGSTDITTSIAARIKNDSTGQSVGYAGKEAVLPGKGTKGLTINTTSFSDTNVRKGTYLLSRRLFLQNAVASGQPVGDQPSDTAGVNIADGGAGAAGKGGGTSQITAEQNLFTYMTDTTGSLTGGTPGRCIVDPIVSSLNFITCGTDCTVDASTLPNNLCAKVPASPVASPLSAFVPNGSFGASGAGGTKSIDSTGKVWNGTTTVAAACAAGALCASGVCTAGLTCPIYTGARPKYSACVQNSDCVSGTTCQDYFVVGDPNGAYLICN